MVMSASVQRDGADLIEEAAEVVGETVSGFIGVAAVKRAEKVLAREKGKAA